MCGEMAEGLCIERVGSRDGSCSDSPSPHHGNIRSDQIRSDLRRAYDNIRSLGFGSNQFGLDLSMVDLHLDLDLIWILSIVFDT